METKKSSPTQNYDASSFRMALHEEINQQMKHLVVPRKPLDENVFIDDFNQGTGPGPIFVECPIDRPALITSIIWSSSATQTLTIVIGDRSIQISNNAALMTDSMPTNIVLYPKDVISITSGGGTPWLFLEIFGHPLDGVEWSKL